MNNFTKEELQILSEYLDYPIEEIVGMEGNRLQIFSKLQSMIDNYCDHEWRCWDDEYNTKECIKCGTGINE